MLCYVCEDIQTTACMKHVHTSQFSLLKSLLQMNPNSLIIKQNRNKQTNKKNMYNQDQFQNSIVRLSFLCRVTDIKIA